MKKNPLISVIMPAYNAEEHLGEAVRSIIKQTYKNWELLIINDASLDRTGFIAEEFAKKDERIKVFHLEKNTAQWFCRNFGIEKSKGDFIAWMDSDDISLPDRLRRQMALMSRYPEVAMVGTNYINIDTQGRKIKKPRIAYYLKARTKTITMNSYVEGVRYFQHCSNNNCFIRKNILKQIKKPYYRPIAIGEDTDFGFRLLERGCIIYVMPDILYKYRIHQQQLTQNHTTASLFIHILHGAHICRLLKYPDPIDALLKKNINLTEENIPLFMREILRYPQLFHHKRFLHEFFIFREPSFYQYRFVLSLYLPYMLQHRQFTWRLLQKKCKKVFLINPYLALPFLHRPWRAFKKIMGRK